MNLVFIMGKVIDKVDFNFIINSKNISVVNFKIELSNKSVVELKAYNKLADYIYKKVEENCKVFIYGEIVNYLDLKKSFYILVKEINLI